MVELRHKADADLVFNEKEEKMRITKRVIAEILSITVVLGAAGCGNNKKTPADTAAAKAEELTIWCWDENFNIPIMETAAEYYRQAGHPDFKVNIVNIPEPDLENKAITAFTSGIADGLPDILLMGDYSAQSFLKNYAGKYADLSDVIHAEDFAPNKIAAYTVDGRLYGVPFDSGSAGMYYRKDYFEQAGYTEEDLQDITWKELVEIGKDVKAATGKYVFVFTPYKGTHYMQIALQSAGKWFYQEDGESPDFKNNEVIRQMCEVLKAMNDADLIYPVDYYSPEGIAAIQTGEAAAHISAVWYIPTLTSVEEMSGKWGYTNVPALEGIDGATKYSNIGGSSWVVLEDSKNKELAKDFLATVYDGNLEFYDRILEEQGAVATYLPSVESEVYKKEIPYFDDKAIYSDFAEWGQKIPAVNYGENTNVAEDAIRAVLQQYLDGTKSLDEMLEEAEKVYKVQLGL